MDKSGLYKIIDNTNQTLQVFCDFNSEPAFAWNLVESFSLSNKDSFQVNILKVEENIFPDLARKKRVSVKKRYYRQRYHTINCVKIIIMYRLYSATLLKDPAALNIAYISL